MWTEQLHPNPPPQRGFLTRCEVNSGADMNVLKHYLTLAGSPAVHIRAPLNSAEVRSRSVLT